MTRLTGLEGGGGALDVFLFVCSAVDGETVEKNVKRKCFSTVSRGEKCAIFLIFPYTGTNLIARIRWPRPDVAGAHDCLRFPAERLRRKKKHNYSVGLVQIYKGGGSGASPAADCNANKYPVTSRTRPYYTRTRD